MNSQFSILNSQFIKSHACLVRTIAYQYDFPPMTHHDLMQEGYMGLMEAAKHYDPSTNLTFDRYASWWIRKFITRAMNRQVPTISLTAVRCKEDEHPLTFEDTVPNNDDTPDMACIRKENYAALYRAIDALGERERLVIMHLFGLRDAELLTRDQLAQRLQITYWGVDQLYHRTLVRLRSLLPHVF